MMGKSPNAGEQELFRPRLADFIDMGHELVHFRKRIGAEGVRKIFGRSVRLWGKATEEELAVSDTTVQGNGTAFPTDAGLYKKVIVGCNRIAREAGVTQRQTYVRTCKELLKKAYNGRDPRRRKGAEAAKRKLRTLAGRLTPERRERHGDRLALFVRIPGQTRTSKDKVYSIHKLRTACIAKGKAWREYEFGNKAGLICTARSQVIVAIRAFEGNPHDGRTIDPLLEQMERAGMRLPKKLAYDRGGRGPKACRRVQILTPGRPSKGDTAWQRRKKRHPSRRRAGIEPLIGHLKSGHRMQENYLRGKDSATVNALPAATAWKPEETDEGSQEGASSRLSLAACLHC